MNTVKNRKLNKRLKIKSNKIRKIENKIKLYQFYYNILIYNLILKFVSCGQKFVCREIHHCQNCSPMCFPKDRIEFTLGVMPTCDVSFNF